MKHIGKIAFGFIIIVSSFGSVFAQTDDKTSSENKTIEDSAQMGFTITITTGRRNLRRPIIPNSIPILIDVKLDKTVVVSNLAEKDSKIEIFSEVFDADNDPLVFSYTVSGGKIIGNGQKVIWDLSGMEVGVYTITVAADDGCGICGEKIVKEVVVY